MILEYIQGLLNVWIKECFREKVDKLQMSYL